MKIAARSTTPVTAALIRSFARGSQKSLATWFALSSAPGLHSIAQIRAKETVFFVIVLMRLVNDCLATWRRVEDPNRSGPITRCS